MPKLDPSSAPQATAAAPAQPSAPATPAPAPQTSGASTATPANAPPAAPAEPIDVQSVAEQLAEAKETGNIKEAARLRGLLDNRSTEAAPAPDSDPEPAAAPVLEDDPPAGDTPGDPADTAPADPDPDPPADPDLDPDAQPSDTDPALDLPKELPNRLRTGHLSKEDRAKATAIHALTMGGMTYEQASDIVLGAGRAPVPAPALDDRDFAGQPTGHPAPPHPLPPSQALADLEAEVQQLEQQLIEKGAYEGQYNTEIATLSAKFTRATARMEAQRSDEQAVARQAQRDQAAHTTQVKASEAKAFKDFPAAKDKAGPLYARFLEKCLAANHPSHPDHAHSFAADAPEYFLAKAAEEMGIKPAAPNGRTVPVPPASAVRGAGSIRPAPAPGTNAAPVTRPAPGTKASAPPPPPKTSAQLVEEKYAEVEAVETGRKPGSHRRIGGLITL